MVRVGVWVDSWFSGNGAVRVRVLTRGCVLMDPVLNVCRRCRYKRSDFVPVEGLPIGRGVRLREYYRLIPGEYNVVVVFLRVAGVEVRGGFTVKWLKPSMILARRMIFTGARAFIDGPGDARCLELFSD